MFLIKIQCRLRKYLANRYVDDMISRKVFRQVEKGWKIGDLQKQKGLRPNLTSVPECFYWKFAEKAKFCGFDVFSRLYKKLTGTFFEKPSLASPRPVFAVQ